MLVLYFFQQIPSHSFCKIQFNYNETSLELLIFLKLSPPDLSRVWLLLLLSLWFSYVVSSLMLLECVKNEILGEHVEAAEPRWVPACCGAVRAPWGAGLPPALLCPASSQQYELRWKHLIHKSRALCGRKPVPGETRKSVGFWKAPKMKRTEGWS